MTSFATPACTHVKRVIESAITRFCEAEGIYGFNCPYIYGKAAIPHFTGTESHMHSVSVPYMWMLVFISGASANTCRFEQRAAKLAVPR